MVDTNTLREEDVVPVRSRVSWGAIFAGGGIALATYFVLTLLGVAVGLSVAGNVQEENLGMGAGIWAVLSTLIALFVGGFVTSQCTVGENRMESLVHGTIMWGVFFVMILWLMASGVRSGFNAVLGVANIAQATSGDISRDDWERTARQFGVSQAQIDEWRKEAANAPENAQRAANDPANREAMQAGATKAAWWGLAGTVLSMFSAMGGALVGAGRTMRDLTWRSTRVVATTTTAPGEVAGRRF